jgi:hypothetical protein
MEVLIKNTLAKYNKENIKGYLILIKEESSRRKFALVQKTKGKINKH